MCLCELLTLFTHISPPTLCLLLTRTTLLAEHVLQKSMQMVLMRYEHEGDYEYVIPEKHTTFVDPFQSCFEPVFCVVVQVLL